MMRILREKLWLFVVALMALPGAAFAEPLTIDLAQDHVKITSGFTGSHMALFGTKTQKGDVIVVLEGPLKDTKVRQKKRVMGAWVNRASLVFEDIPSYYDYAISVENESDILSADLLKEKRIGLKALKALPREKKYDEQAVKEFQKALLRNKKAQDFYPVKPLPVQFISENLFRVDFQLPANVPYGQYTVRGLLVNNGQIVYEQTKNVQIGLTGFNAGVYKFSINYSFLYGVLCVFLACLAGWLSNAIARRN